MATWHILSHLLAGQSHNHEVNFPLSIVQTNSATTLLPRYYGPITRKLTSSPGLFLLSLPLPHMD